MNCDFSSFMIGFGVGGFLVTCILGYVLWDEDRRNQAVRDMWRRHADNAISLEADLQARILEVNALIAELGGKK